MSTQTKQTVIEKLRRFVQRGKRISPRVKQALELIDLLESESPERWDLIRFLGIAGKYFDPEILKLGAFQIPEQSILTPATAAMHTLQEYLGIIPTKAEQDLELALLHPADDNAVDSGSCALDAGGAPDIERIGFCSFCFLVPGLSSLF